MKKGYAQKDLAHVVVSCSVTDKHAYLQRAVLATVANPIYAAPREVRTEDAMGKLVHKIMNVLVMSVRMIFAKKIAVNSHLTVNAWGILVM